MNRKSRISWPILLLILIFQTYLHSVQAATTDSCDTNDDYITVFALVAIRGISVPIEKEFIPNGQCAKADFNGDGRLDLYIQGNNKSDTSYIFLADQTGNYTAISQSWNNGYIELNWSSVDATIFIADYNGDGRDDIILDSNADGGVSAILYADATGKFTEAGQTWVYQSEADSTIAKVTPGNSGESLSISPSGATTYSIPIDVPPGINGLQPNLSLTYNSQGSNGPLGVGWALAGLSQISRCPRTYDQDGQKAGIDLNSNDRFCIDGQRLISVSGTYGADGSTYRTELDNLSKITAKEVAGGGPSWFEVETKSSMTMEYGNGNYSAMRAENSSTRISWLLNRITDQSQNELSVTYSEDNTNGFYPVKRIDYGKNLSVRFSYSSRTDSGLAYIAGSQVKTPQRLTYIRTYAGERLVKEYRISYEYSVSSQRSLVSAIVECDKAGVCKKPIDLKWATGGSEFMTTTKTSSSLDWGYSDSRWWVDFNGDGLTDYCRRVGSTSNRLISCTLSTGTGFGQTIYSNHLDWGYTEGRQWADINGDGMVDYCRVIGNTGSYRVQCTLSEGNSFGETITSNVADPGYSDSRWWVDFNGDGLTDYCRRVGGTSNRLISCTLSTGTGFGQTIYSNHLDWGYTEGRQWADLNGDGMMDYCRVIGNTGNYRVQCTLSEGNSFGETITSDVTDPGYSDGRWWVDFNGDGLSDYCRRAGNTSNRIISCLLSKGNDFGQVIYSSHLDWGYEVGRQWVDVNGDYKNDYCRLIGNTGNYRVQCTLSTGIGFGRTVTSDPLDRGYDEGREWVDFSGNGRADYCRVVGVSGNGRIQCTSGSFDVVDSVYQIKDTTGFATEINYSPLTDKLVYEKSSAIPLYPIQNAQNAVYVVSSTTQEDGIGGKHITSYEYEGSKLHLRGRSSLGFARVIQTDEATNTVTTTEYHQQTTTADSYTLAPGVSDFWKTGRVKKTTTTVNGVLVNEAINTWDTVVTDVGTLIPYAQQSVQKNYNYDVPGSLLSQVTTTVPAWPSGIDNWGNVTESTTVTTDSATGKQYAETTKTTYYPADTVNWLIGLPQTQTITNRVPDERYSGVTNLENKIAKEWTYYPGTQRVWNESIKKPEGSPYQSGDHYLEVTKTYEYHAVYGYQNKVTVTGASVATPRVTTTHINYDYISPDGLTDAYEVTVTNAKGHQEKRVVDMRTGKILQMRGPNQLAHNQAHGTDYKTQWFYDGFGRKLLERRADGNETRWEYRWCDINCLYDNEVYFVRVSADGKPTKTVYYDKLGRDVRTERTGFLGNLINARKQYDALGRVKGVTKNYFRTGGTPYWTCTQYDDLGRSVKTSVPTTVGCANVAALPHYTTTAYNGLYKATTVYNDGTAGNQTKHRWKNVLGQVVKIKDALDNLTHYYYNAIGKLIEVKDALGNKVKTTYDRRGRKIAMDDPDMGQWAYRYNALGEMTWQQDAKGQIVKLHYDELGRLTKREEPDGTETRWYFDTAPNGIGKLDTVKNTANVYSRQYTYDNFGRPTSVQTEILAQYYHIDTTYDNFGRVETITYPDTDPTTGVRRFAVQNHYDNYGHLQKVTQAGASTVYWTAHDRNADGKVLDETLGNTIDTVYTYDEIFGRLTYISSAAGQNLQDSQFVYDRIGNLEERHFMSGNTTVQDVSETFTYDGLNRLKSATIAGLPTQTYDYNAVGNITHKSDYGDTYRYNTGANAVRPHAVNTITNGGVQIANYTYDANGNMRQRQVSNGTDITIDYTWFNKPSQITATGKQSDFSYDDQHMRIMQTTEHGVTTYLNPRRDLGGHYEKEIKNGITKHKHTIYGSTGAVALYTVQEDTGDETTRYMLKDHLGSVEAMVNEDGTIHKRFSYDAFGKRRSLADLGDTSYQVEHEFHHGYTGHEHLDQFELIHMNGRLYDPNAGRFMSADPFVKFAGSSQGFNRYSYTDNNPLSRVDLNGYGWLSKTWKKVKKKVARVTSKIVNKVSQIKYVGGLLTLGIMTNNSFSFAYGTSTGDWKSVARSHAAGAVIAAGYYYGGVAANNYTTAITANTATASTYITAGAQYVGHSAAVGYLSSYSMARIYGASNNEALEAARAGAYSAAKTALIDAISLAMRQYEIGRSPSVSGDSDGIRGISGKLGGCRGCDRSTFFDRLTNFGGDQSGSGELFMIEYGPGSFGDTLVESFAGAHDFLNDMIGWYDSAGNTVSSGTVLMDVGNVFNVALATPIAVATFKQHYGYGPIEHSQSIVSGYYR